MPRTTSAARGGRRCRRPWQARDMPDAYRERVLPSVWVWLLVPAGAALLYIMLLPISVGTAVVGAVILMLILALLLVRASPSITVADGWLRVDRARLPVAVISGVRTLSGTELEQALGVDLDARAHVRHRAWARQAVQLQLEDPDDPTPYWLVSTRHASQLRTALERPENDGEQAQ